MTPPRGSAADQLMRLLYLLPAAAEAPVRLVDAAERLGVDVDTIMTDLADVTAREYYHPAGGAEDIRVEVEGDSFRVHTHRKFQRPARLGPGETLATHLALRRYAAGLDEETRAAVLDLARRIAAQLATDEVADLTERFAVEEGGEAGDLRLALRRAVREGTRCRMTYLRAVDGELTERTLDPYEVVIARGSWFVVGWCGLREDVRLFRIDRILELEPTGETFERPADFDVARWVDDGRVFRSAASRSVVIEYRGLSAGLIEERGPVDARQDGRVRVTYEVADPGWVVRHVLERGGEAEVVEPEEIRALVAGAAERLADPEPEDSTEE